MKTSSFSINRWSSRSQLMNEQAKNPPLTSSSIPGNFTRESKTLNLTPQQEIDSMNMGKEKSRLKQGRNTCDYCYLKVP